MLGALASLITNPKVISGIGDFVSSALDKVSPTIGNVVRTLTGSNPQVVTMPAAPVLPASNNANSMSSVVVPNSSLNRMFMPNSNVAQSDRYMGGSRRWRGDGYSREGPDGEYEHDDDAAMRIVKEREARARRKSKSRKSRSGKYRSGIYR
jgi:hypothetical protein